MANFNECVTRVQVALFLINLLNSVVLAVVLTGIVWLIKRFFFRRAAMFPVFAIAATAFGFVLGLLDIFVIPQFEKIYSSFGADLPAATSLLLEFRHFLWAPLLVIVLLEALLRARFARKCHGLTCLGIEILLLAWILMSLYAPIAVLGGCTR